MIASTTAVAPRSQTLAPSKQRMGTLKEMLEKNKHSIASVIPKHMSPDRLLKIALVAASRNKRLLECDPQSILRSLITASQLGLEPETPLGSCYLVPYRNTENRTMEAQFILGYRGMIELARRSGQISTIEAHIVYENDKFRCHFGLNPVLEHEPSWDDTECAKTKAVYAVAKLKDGSVQHEVMTYAQIEAVRKRSKAKDSGPWVTDWSEMARKTVVKRLCKYLPMSIEIVEAIEADRSESIDTGYDVTDTVDSDEPAQLMYENIDEPQGETEK